MTEALTPVEIFCSYAHADEEWRKKLDTHLSLLKRQGLVSFWHDRLIVPGTDWAKTIDIHLDTASIILLLVSADFFASDYCYGIEMKRALERQEVGEARVIPILVRQADWIDTPFAHLQALPSDAKPLATWQDEDTALADVAAGIRRAIVEELPQLTASASSATLPTIWNVPYPRNPFFLGRNTELAMIRHNLQTGQVMAFSQPQAISGLGGIGKTQLALEYAYRYHQDYQVVLWARAESTEELVSSYVAIASLLRLPQREARKQEIIVQAVKTWLQTHSSWLLILDNADDLTLLPDFLPSSLGGHLLLTTRAQSVGQLASRLEIETLSLEQSALFLLRRAKLIAQDAELSRASQEERALALQISRELGGLPLALDQAGAYIEETFCGQQNYLSHYQTRQIDLLKRRGSDIVDHSASVATTLALAFENVEKTSSAAADLLRLCAFLHPDAISEEIFIQGIPDSIESLRLFATDPLGLDEAVSVLLKYSLVHRNPTTKTLTIHRLLQVILQDAMTEDTRLQWIENTVRIISKISDSKNPFHMWQHEAQMYSQLYLPHIQRCLDLIREQNILLPEATRLLQKTGEFLLHRKRYAIAKPLYEHLLIISKQTVGQEHPDVATHMCMLADICCKLGVFRRNEYIEAERLYREALTIYRQAFGQENVYVVHTMMKFARLLRKTKRWREATKLSADARTLWVNLDTKKENDHLTKASQFLKSSPFALLQFSTIGIIILLCLILRLWWMIGAGVISVLLHHLISYIALKSQPRSWDWDYVPASILSFITPIMPGTVFGLIGWNLGSLIALKTHLSGSPVLTMMVTIVLAILSFLAGYSLSIFEQLFIFFRLDDDEGTYTFFSSITYALSTVVIPISLGVLLQSWWIFGVSLLSNLALLIILFKVWKSALCTSRYMVFALFGLPWSFLGWFFGSLLAHWIHLSSFMIPLSCTFAVSSFLAGWFCHFFAYYALDIECRLSAFHSVDYLLEE